MVRVAALGGCEGGGGSGGGDGGVAGAATAVATTVVTVAAIKHHGMHGACCETRQHNSHSMHVDCSPRLVWASP